MIRIMFKLLILLLGAVCIQQTALATLQFTDIDVTHEVYPDVVKLVEDYKILAGFPDKTFRGEKILTRSEFAKALVGALSYVETESGLSLKALTSREVNFKDIIPENWAYPFVLDLVSAYQIISGFPDGTFRGKSELNRYQVAVALAKAVSKVEQVSGNLIEVKEIAVPDLPASHWAYASVQKLISAGIISVDQDGFFKGKELVSRYELSSLLVKFIDFSLLIFNKKNKEVSQPLGTEPWAAFCGGWGNVYEGASGTNNWLGTAWAAAYGNTFTTGDWSGNYEIVGKYGFNRVNYLVPAGGAVVNENRYDLALNTIYPTTGIYGVGNKMVVGLEYINLSNALAPTDFMVLTLGLEDKAEVLGKKFLVRASYSLPFFRFSTSPSAFGQPSYLFDYEFSHEAEAFSLPILFGWSGEVMIFSGGATRFYNNVFFRYFMCL